MNSRQIPCECVPAYHTPVEDKALRFYIQTQILAGPADPAAFYEAVEAFRRSFSQRSVSPLSTNAGRIVELDNQDAECAPSTRSEVLKTYDSLGYDTKEVSRLITDFGWKVDRLTDSHSQILSIGCGSGNELVFLRARYPNASITALDYPMKPGSRDKIIEAVRCEFIAGDIFNSLTSFSTRGDSFDLIFSNHVIEHLYEPDEQIRNMTQLLRPGGVFAAGLPLDAYPHQELLAKKAKRVETIHALDIDWLNLRHPWKTNELDLALTLDNANLRDVTIYRRLYHTSRIYPGSWDDCRRRERRAAVFYSLLLNVPLSVLKVGFGKNPPRRLARLVFALDRRLWFGRYRLKCDTEPEVFVTASRS